MHMSSKQEDARRGKLAGTGGQSGRIDWLSHLEMSNVSNQMCRSLQKIRPCCRNDGLEHTEPWMLSSSAYTVSHRKWLVIQRERHNHRRPVQRRLIWPASCWNKYHGVSIQTSGSKQRLKPFALCKRSTVWHYCAVRYSSVVRQSHRVVA
jgi:hypothetical protein